MVADLVAAGVEGSEAAALGVENLARDAGLEDPTGDTGVTVVGPTVAEVPWKPGGYLSSGNGVGEPWLARGC